MKINKFLKMLVLSVAVVGSISTTSAFASTAPPGWDTNGNRVDSNGTVIETNAEVLVRQNNNLNELGTKIIVARVSGTGASNEVNPKTGQGCGRYTKDDGTPYTGIFKDPANASVWYILDENGFLVSNAYVTQDGKTYRTGQYGNMIATINYTSDGHVFWLDQAANELPVCETSTWKKINNQWYYLDSTGLSVQNQWQKSGNDWYYLGADGKMATSTTIDGYTLDSTGKLV